MQPVETRPISTSKLRARIRASRLALGAGGLALIVACGGQEEPKIEQEWAVGGDPPRGAPLPSGHTIPGLADDQLSGNVTSLDALGQPAPMNDLEQWADRVADPQITPPALRGRLQEAIDAVDTGFVFGDTTQTFAYEPERARWIADLGIPPGMEELRLRGARLYCAAKAAFEQRRDATVRMGKRTAATLNILGAKIDVMGIEPAIALGAPRKFISNENDGAQAFSIPIKVGTKFTPLSILPFLTRDQEQVVYLTTADGAVLNEYGPGGVLLHTATHADAFTGFTGETSDSFRFPLFTFLFGSVDLNLAYTWGQAACAQNDTYEGCQFSPQSKVRRMRDSSAEGYPGKRRGGATAQPVLLPDGTLSNWGIVNDGAWSPAGSTFVINEIIGVAPLAYAEPMQRRASQNNDKSIEVQTAIGVSAGAAVNVGATWGPFDLGVEFGVDLVSNLFTTHRIREQQNGIEYDIPAGEEFTAIAALPVTDLSVTPELRSDFGLQMNLTLRLGLDLPVVGYIGFRRTLINAGASTPIPGPSQFSSGWPEANRLRISTALSADGSLDTANVVSHWPRSDIFPAHPQSIQECLGSPAPDPLPNVVPRACESEPAPSTPLVGIQADVCFATPLPYPDHPFNTPCHGRRLQFAQSGRTSERDFRGMPHAVRILDDGALEELAQIMRECAPELASADSMKEMFESGFTMCDANGTPFDTDQAVQHVADPPPDAIQEPSECR